MELRELLTRVDSLLSPVVESLGYELIECEYTNEHGRWILRLYIDVEGRPISVEDCEKVSGAVGAILDVENIMPSSYNPEVSSPGIPRPLRRVKDFEKYLGATVKIRTVNKINERRNFTGIIKGVKEGVVYVFENEETFAIPINEIFKARMQDAGLSGGD